LIHINEFEYELILASKPKKKLMIVLHGRGDSLRPFRDFDEELKVPGLNYLLINAPRKYETGFTWYAFPPHQAKGVLLARKKLMKMMAELEKQGWKSRDIFFLGFSQGALVSCDFGMHYPKQLGGIIGISGYIYFFNNWRRSLQSSAFRTPWLLTHGKRDDALAIEETRRDVARLKDAGIRVQWKEFNKEHEIEETRELPFLRRWIQSKM
jgi:phospholipase/carboxylesterase